MPLRPTSRLGELDAKKIFKDVDNFLFDCDGVIWHLPNAIPGSVECVNQLKKMGKKCFFITNNNSKTRQTVVENLKKVGVDNVTEDDIVCTAWVLAGYLNEIGYKDKLYVIGSAAISHELDQYGIKYTGIGSNHDEYPDPLTYDFKNKLQLDADVKGVVVAFDHYFNYAKMVIAGTYLHHVPDCLFIATNDDALLPTGNQSKAVIPGTGTFVSAMKTIAGREPIILGKPNKTMFDVLAQTHGIDASRTCMIGDRLETDIAFAANCSMAYGLAVLSGITNEKEILSYSNRLNEGSVLASDEAAKCVPDFYMDTLGDLAKFF